MKSASFSRISLATLVLGSAAFLAQAEESPLLTVPASTPEGSSLSISQPSASPETLPAHTPAELPTPNIPKVAGLDASKFQDPVAKVNGKSVPRRDLEILANGILASQGGTLVNIPPDQRAEFYKSVLQQMINEKLISEKAINQEVTDEEVEAELAKIRSQYPDEKSFTDKLAAAGKNVDLLKIEIASRKRQQKYLEAQLKQKIKITDADTKKFYKENPALFEAPDSLRASQILIAVPADATMEVRGEKMKKAKEIAAQLQKDPAKFEEVAKTQSDDPKVKQTGGDVGTFTKKGFPYPEFYDAVDKLKVGEVSDPIRTPDGFHVVKLTERKPARTIPYDEAKERVTAFLNDQKRQEEFQKLVVVLRKGAKIEIFQEELK